MRFLGLLILLAGRLQRRWQQRVQSKLGALLRTVEFQRVRMPQQNRVR